VVVLFLWVLCRVSAKSLFSPSNSLFFAVPSFFSVSHVFSFVSSFVRFLCNTGTQVRKVDAAFLTRGMSSTVAGALSVMTSCYIVSSL
jgi:hypothetical protein